MPFEKMHYYEWQRYYRMILSDFAFSEDKDRQSAEILSQIVNKRGEIKKLYNLISGKKVYIFGAASSLDNEIKQLNPCGVKIAADGATSCMLENGLIPEIIVTDLDGKLNDLVEAERLGAVVVILAHGDNIETIKKYAKRFKNPFPTTQGEPFGNLYNFGGFTDGDRSVFLAEHFRAEKIILLGFDFENVGKYSFKTNHKIKLKKLKWAKFLIEELKIRGAKIEFGEEFE